ncbi:hypothetical protein HPB48_024785 [Haemaphysalis longicornis]|uniref:Uncharacterized protein n=1 Tax=Haemaphysalis longicornis TaxID=44386 RepID=A0A9J6H8M3_HAELO|nr:hypothetical protein HPB48_024785 [Haemaphysalis longicornis]
MQKNGRKGGHKSRGSQASSFPENETRNANNVLLPERNQCEPTHGERKRKKENLSTHHGSIWGQDGAKKAGKTKRDRMGESKKEKRGNRSNKGSQQGNAETLPLTLTMQKRLLLVCTSSQVCLEDDGKHSEETHHRQTLCN